MLTCLLRFLSTGGWNHHEHSTCMMCLNLHHHKYLQKNVYKFVHKIF